MCRHARGAPGWTGRPRTCPPPSASLPRVSRGSLCVVWGAGAAVRVLSPRSFCGLRCGGTGHPLPAASCVWSRHPGTQPVARTKVCTVVPTGDRALGLCAGYRFVGCKSRSDGWIAVSRADVRVPCEVTLLQLLVGPAGSERSCWPFWGVRSLQNHTGQSGGSESQPGTENPCFTRKCSPFRERPGELSRGPAGKGTSDWGVNDSFVAGTFERPRAVKRR